MHDKQLILSIFEQGSRIVKSGVFPTEVFEEGRSVGYEDRLIIKRPVTSIATRKLIIPEKTVEFLSSTESCPNNIHPKQWARMNEIERIKTHAKAIAEGHEFKIKFV
jgi:hypothetical protein